jgi:uncharacterized protein YutD
MKIYPLADGKFRTLNKSVQEYLGIDCKYYVLDNDQVMINLSLKKHRFQAVSIKGYRLAPDDFSG